MARRGAYAKGVAKREEILTTALDVIARNGYRRTSVRELAEAVGLSQAGLLHYFSSKEELFAEILRKRDEVDTASLGAEDEADPLAGLVGIVRHNAEVPGLVQLYAQLSTEASDAAHPAHEFFTERYRRFRGQLAETIARRAADGSLPAHLDADKLATLLLATADGLQTQWMLDPELDMAAHIEYLLSVLGDTSGS